VLLDSTIHILLVSFPGFQDMMAGEDFKCSGRLKIERSEWARQHTITTPSDLRERFQKDGESEARIMGMAMGKEEERQRVMDYSGE